MRKAAIGLLVTIALLVALAVAAALLMQFSYAPLPDRAALANPEPRDLSAVAYDLLGERITLEQAADLMKTAAGAARLSPAHGAVPVDSALRHLGREAFYRETFGNEYFLSDVLGILDGGLTPYRVGKALLRLAGRGTTNLQVELARRMTIAGTTYPEGIIINTGLDVPKGGWLPLGLKTFYDRGRVRIGITCAACHATVDAKTGKVLEGAPNSDLAVGFLLTLASNSAAYFTHVALPSLAPFIRADSPSIVTATGARQKLPDRKALEAHVDALLAAWPPGSFDSTTDLANDPTSIPDTFTFDAGPYGWSGFAAVGPFRGLNMLANNIHALNADATADMLAAPSLFGMDPELYLGILLQGAPDPAFRFDPKGARKPSDVLAAADPTPGSPGLDHVVPLPTFPKASYVSTDGLLSSLPGYPVWHHVSAMSAFQETLMPPALPPQPADPAEVAQGKVVFAAAGCGGCHGGPAFTNHDVLPAPAVGSEPSRARALSATERSFAPSVLYYSDTPVPLPKDAATFDLPIDDETRQRLRLAWGQGGTPGGYKVKALIGLAWTAPYLHDGSIAVGADAGRDLGVPGTLLAGRPVDPANSLRALLDRGLREKVIAANRRAPELAASHVDGAGHAFWVDRAAGFDDRQQKALVDYLLSLTRPADAPSVAGGAPAIEPAAGG